MQFKIGLWSAATRKYDFTLDSVSERASSIKKAIKILDNDIKSSATSKTQKISGIFVAPEYFFTERLGGVKDFKNNIIQGKELNENERDQCVEMLRGISSKYPHIMIVPGTIVWSKSLNMNSKKGNPRRGRAIEHMEHYIQRGASNSKMLDANPRTGEVMIGRYPYKASSIGSTARLQKLKSDGQHGGADYYMRNTAYIFLDGEVVYKYHKNGDFYESVNTDDVVFIPSMKDPIKSILATPRRNLTFGFEICVDHHIESLKSFLASAPVRDVDFHILTSATVDVDATAMCMREGGYFLHATDSEKDTDVYVRKNNAPVKIDPVSTETVGNASLKIYHISFNSPDDETYINKVDTAVKQYSKEKTIFASSESKIALSTLQEIISDRDSLSLREHIEWYLGKSSSRPANAGNKIPVGKRLYTILSSI